MVEVIKDIQLMESAHKSLSLRSAEQKLMRDTSYTIIFNKHNTTAAEFDSSLRVYTKHPEVFTEIMEEVASQLNSTK